MYTKPIFRPSFGNRPDSLVGRDEIINRIVEGLQSYPGSSERATLIIGQRGMGKTALLLDLSDRSRSLGYIAVRVTCGENMLDNLIELLQREGSAYIKDNKSSIKGFSAGALGFSFGLTFTEEAQRTFGFRVKLQMICEKLATCGKRVLILVDEVDPSILQMRELATAYQELIGSETDIAIIMAGLPTAISNTLNYRTLTFLNRSQQISLGLVPVTEVEFYYRSAFERASLMADNDIIKRAALATDGFPYKIQLIGYYLSKLSIEGKPLTLKDLNKANEAASEEVELKVFDAMLNPLSDMDINFLTAMARIDGKIRISDIENSLGITHGTAQTYRRRLLDAGIISSPRRGELEFTMPQLSEYLLKQDLE